ncbi:unnamed protein product [Euphydryas editha]|uniref:Uncharacterized protein n=1 Tax=Euphydryas editha TaxID=104508 RepID=A0AAU9THS3_EUPED|nr:unnamed protein product [Euphydryas editha]
MIKITSWLLVLCSAALGQNINLQTNPVNFRRNSRDIFSALRLPVGLGNPPPPLGSGQDPATQSCGLIPPFCVKSRYRTIDGSCNNLLRPTLGTPQTPYARLVPYKYGDGQLESIRTGSSMARLLCDNSNNIQHMQPKAFQQISYGNMPVLCQKLPSINLSLWQDNEFH